MSKSDSAFKALADPTRRRILGMLGESEMTAGEIAGHFNISAPSMSHHFNILKEADLISARRNGQQIHYSLNTTVVQDVMGALMDIFSIGSQPIGETDES
jgi:DNA-binding transcriptional ArsR family regulator